VGENTSGSIGRISPQQVKQKEEGDALVEREGVGGRSMKASCVGKGVVSLDFLPVSSLEPRFRAVVRSAHRRLSKGTRCDMRGTRGGGGGGAATWRHCLGS
jgi:hypothetical protein